MIRGRQTAAAAAGFSNGPVAAAAPVPAHQPPQQNPQEAQHPPDSSVNPRNAGPNSKMGDLEKAMDRLGMVR